MKWTRRDPEREMFNEQLRARREENMTAQAVSDDMGGLAERESRTDLLRWQQELEDELIQLKMQLRSKELNEHNKWVIKKTWKNGQLTDMKPMLNEAGISTLIGIVRPLLSRNLINSNLEDEFIRSMLQRTCDDIINSLAYYGNEWQAEFGNYSTIVRTIKNAIIPTPFRARGGWTKTTDSTISKRFEGYTESGEKPKQNTGVFSRILGG